MCSKTGTYTQPDETAPEAAGVATRDEMQPLHQVVLLERLHGRNKA